MVNGTVSVPIIDGILSGAAERTAKWDPKKTVRRGGMQTQKEG